LLAKTFWRHCCDYCADIHCEQLCVCRRRCTGDAEFSSTPPESTSVVWQSHY